VDAHGRILAVIGLQENTFRPFTNANTSVLFLEKWSDPKEGLTDYEIFTNVSRRPGKSNTGQPRGQLP